VGYQKPINVFLKKTQSFKGAAANIPNSLQATDLGLELESSHCRPRVRVKPRVRVRIRYDNNEHKLWMALWLRPYKTAPLAVYTSSFLNYNYVYIMLMKPNRLTNS